MAETEQLLQIVARLSSGEAAGTDVETLLQALRSGEATVVNLSSGERAVSIGGSVTGSIIATGDGARILQLNSADPVLLAALQEFLSSPLTATSNSQLWNVPYTRNPFFTAREDSLDELDNALTSDKPVALTQPAALTGMGGIGKTQAAVEYAYRYRDQYQAVFWVHAETEVGLRAGYVEIARMLGLPQVQEAAQILTVTAVKDWLDTKKGWLLVLDNADDLALVKPFLPHRANGHILLTTRAASTGAVARPVLLEKMSDKQGALLLLRRSWRIKEDAQLDDATQDDRLAALEIARKVDGLPLALDQAGAFIEEAQSSPTEYLDIFQKEGARMLAEYGNSQDRDHASVAVTFSLAFNKAAINPIVGDLMRACAFLAPDSIPEEVFTESDSEWGKPLAEATANSLSWFKTLREACRYSLLTRDADTKALNVHRLVQEVLKEGLSEEERHIWCEKAIRVLDTTFPQPEFNNWHMCDRLMPHALLCIHWIEEITAVTAEAANLLNNVAYYLFIRARHTKVEALFLWSIEIWERVLGPEHPSTATGLNNLASFYSQQGRYADAEPLYLRALKIWERVEGPQHPTVALILSNLAEVYNNQARYGEAEPLYLRALEIYEITLGPEHPDTASILSSLAYFHARQGHFAEAEPLYLRALAIRENVPEPRHPLLARILNNLAALYEQQGRYAEAEPLHLRALDIWETVLGADHPDTANSMNSLADLYESQARYGEAEALYLRALEIWERVLGPEHPDTAYCINNLSHLYLRQGRDTEAKSLLLRALAIREKAFGTDHPNTAQTLNNLAEVYKRLGNYAGAETMFRRALAIWKKSLGPQHPETATGLNNLGTLLSQQGRYEHAGMLFRRALAIWEKSMGPQHPEIAKCLSNLAYLYEKQGRYEQAESLYTRVRAIQQEVPVLGRPSNKFDKLIYEPLFRTRRRID